MLSRTAAETHKLDLMAEISNLKLKLATSEKERQELNDQLKIVQSSSDETRAKLTQRLREVAELKARLAAYDASSLLSPHSSPGELKADSACSTVYECEMERALQGILAT